jgi:hypothetical protein
MVMVIVVMAMVCCLAWYMYAVEIMSFAIIT